MVNNEALIVGDNHRAYIEVRDECEALRGQLELARKALEEIANKKGGVNPHVSWSWAKHHALVTLSLLGK